MLQGMESQTPSSLLEGTGISKKDNLMEVVPSFPYHDLGSTALLSAYTLFHVLLGKSIARKCGEGEEGEALRLGIHVHHLSLPMRNNLCPIILFLAAAETSPRLLQYYYYCTHTYVVT